MEHKPPSRAFAIGVRVVLVAAVVALTVFQWQAGGWQGVALTWVPLLVFFGPVAVAVNSGRGSLGKRPDGRRSWTARHLFAPYLLATRGVFELARMFSRQKPFAVVAPNLAFGRRSTEREARRTNFVSVLDLAAEFIEVRSFRRLPGYASLPVFDTSAPTPDQMRYAVGWLRAAVARGPVYVHCALGHGRSACVALAYLLAEGKVATVAEGLGLIREQRPKVRLHARQREALRPFEVTPRPT